MQMKTWLLGGVGVLVAGAAIAQTNQSPKKPEVQAEKTVVATNVPNNSSVRILTPEESAVARKLREKSEPSQTNKKGWVRVLPGGKIPSGGDFARSENDWKIVPGTSRFGGQQLILGRGFQSRSVATLSGGKLKLRCVPSQGAAHQHDENCRGAQTKSAVKSSTRKKAE